MLGRLAAGSRRTADDFSAEPREKKSGVRPGEKTREVEDANAVQRGDLWLCQNALPSASRGAKGAGPRRPRAFALNPG